MAMTRDEETALAKEMAAEFDLDSAVQEAERLREQAAQHERDAHESFDRCDTDGALSQWASGLNASKDRLQADITEAGGLWVFPALFDLDGNLAPAKAVYNQFGRGWLLLDEHDRPTGRWFNESNARNDVTYVRNNAKKGFYVGLVRVPAYATLKGASITSVAAVAVRRDGGWSRDAEIVDSGKATT
jgi:hypothetical protein